MSDGHTQAQKDRDTPTIMRLARLANLIGCEGTVDDVLDEAAVALTALRERVERLEGACKGAMSDFERHGFECFCASDARYENPCGPCQLRAALTPAPPAKGIVPPCPNCVSEHGRADPSCPWCKGTGVCPSTTPPAKGTTCSSDKAQTLARLFHDTYERLAPSFGYATRKDTKVFDPESPNGRLMIAVCREIAAAATPDPRGLVEALERCVGFIKGAKCFCENHGDGMISECERCWSLWLSERALAAFKGAADERA